MSTARIALANLRVPSTPEESVLLAISAIAEAGRLDALVICFPECFVPGYRWPGKTMSPPDPAFLEQARIDVAEPGSYRPVTFGEPANTFHEKAILCRAAENTCYFASVNCASEGSGTTSAVARPDGTLQCHQPYGREGLLVADLDLGTATGLFARRCRTSPM